MRGSKGGAPRNWEQVTAAAMGELVKLVCGDDILYPDCLRLQVEAMSNKFARQEYYQLLRARDLLAECNTTVVLQ